MTRLKSLALTCAMALPLPAAAQQTAAAPAAPPAAPPMAQALQAAIVDRVIEDHILPRFRDLAQSTAQLSATAQEHCAGDDPALRAAFGAAFDAWITASHLRFGPTETDTRAFALAFWPDTRGATPRSLLAMISAEDTAVHDPAAFGQVSIAARGFYALEALLYDDAVAQAGSAPYRCALIQAISKDSAATAAAILSDWQDRYSAAMRQDGRPYRSRTEAVQTLYKALNEGLEFTADTRLGRPLGSFERPRPTRAESRRAGRSLRHVMLSTASLKALAVALGQDEPRVAADLATAFDAALEIGAALEDPVFAGVGDPTGRLKVEILQQSVQGARDAVRGSLGPYLGVAAGFNASDGD